MCDPPAGPATPKEAQSHAVSSTERSLAVSSPGGRRAAAGCGLHLHQHDIRGMTSEPHSTERSTGYTFMLAFMLAAGGPRPSGYTRAAAVIMTARRPQACRVTVSQNPCPLPAP